MVGFNIFFPGIACIDMQREMIQLKYTEKLNCSVCLKNMFQKKVKFLRCGHVFHCNCVNSWLDVKRTCPLCRKEIPLKKIKKEEAFASVTIDLLISLLQTETPNSQTDTVSDDSETE